MTEFTDLEGNAAAQVWFTDLTDKLTHQLVLAEVETLRENPYDFVIADPGVMTLPVRYPDQARINLTPLLHPHPTRRTGLLVLRRNRPLGQL
jgi:hypothetical protein